MCSRLIVAAVVAALVGVCVPRALMAGEKKESRTSLPRRVLLLFDGKREALPFSMAHRHATLPLEHLGWAVDTHDIRQGLPPESLGERYGGMVTWFTDDQLPASLRYEAYLLRQLDAGTRIAILGNLGFPPSEKLLQRLGLVETPAGDKWKPPFAVVRVQAPAGYEAVPRPSPGYVLPWSTRTGQVALQVKCGSGETATPIFTAPWGAMALDPYVMQDGYEGRSLWLLDPFAFFQAALGFPPAPPLDLTTENGRRVLTVHVDGDGFASLAEMPGQRFAGEVIRKQILEVFRVPTTVSVIESEVSPRGLYPESAAKLEDIARAIFRLPHVEIASHTYSHPYSWTKAIGQPLLLDPEEQEKLESSDYLPIPGYKYSVAREVNGSVDYINKHLAPAGKRVRTFLWSGDALPDEESIARSDALGLANMNGDNAVEPEGKPILSMVPSSGRWVGKHYQCYSPAQNENVFTNEWTGPFSGYRHAIDIFKYTESPRRLSSIAIYYHFFSGTKIASLAALRDVYRWALDQEVIPMAVTDYTKRVLDFQLAQVSRLADGGFLLDGVAAIRTVRLRPAQGWPDLTRSHGVVGVREVPQGRYVALDGSPRVRLYLQKEPPQGPYLLSSNGRVVSWRWEKQHGQRVASVGLAGGVPLHLTVGGCPKGAAVEGVDAQPEFSRGTAGETTWHFGGTEANVKLFCR
jgi:hypothetical protein